MTIKQNKNKYNMELIKMEYIKKLNWRRYGKQYYRVFIHYIDEDGNNKRLTCRYDWDGIYG